MIKKPIIGEGQMQIDFNQVDSKPVNDGRSEANDELDRRLDELVDIGSYDEAYRILGVPRDNPNVAVSLDERAKLLLQSLDDFAGAAKVDGHISGIVDNHPRFRGKYRDPDAVIESLARKKSNLEYAAALGLRQALGYKALKTIFNEEEVMDGETEDVDKFHKKILGPKNKYSRDKLRAKLRYGVELRSELKSKQDS